MRLIRFAAVALLAAALASCSLTPAPHPSPQPTQPAQAADLRAQLDLLLTEHVMIVAKESAGAINRTDDYAGYVALLSTNEGALTRVVRTAIGNTTAGLWSKAWRALNGDLVEYAIRIATHDGDRADAASARLTATTMPQLADQLADLTLGQSSQFLPTLHNEITALRDMINAQANHTYAAMYVSLATAISAAATIGDMLANGIALRFPDKFPGDQSTSEVVRRVHLNVLMQQRAYLVTMATAAQISGRTAERAQALGALSTNLDQILKELDSSLSRQAWADELSSLQSYAGSGDSASKNALTDTFVADFAAITKVSPGIVSNQVTATIKVIDDQRAKRLDDVAEDDRAAATATQPIADSI